MKIPPRRNWIDRYQKDTVWLGKWAMASDQRGTGLSYWALDHLGTPRREVDALGRSLGSGIVDAFGGDVNVNEAPAERHRFTGHERDHVSGDDGPSLPMGDYMHARGYSPQLGRFFSPDAKRSFNLFEPQSGNRYSYTINNPIKFIDPQGLIFQLSGCGSGATESQCDYQKSLVTENLPEDALQFLTFGPGGVVGLTGISGRGFAERFGLLGEALARLITSPQTFTLITNNPAMAALGRGGYTDPLPQGGANIYIDRASFPQQLGGVLQTGSTGFAHELGHAVSLLFPLYRDVINNKGARFLEAQMKGEGYVVAFENRYRSERRLELRSFYYYQSDVQDPFPLTQPHFFPPHW